jgi:hypothetical protein
MMSLVSSGDDSETHYYMNGDSGHLCYLKKVAVSLVSPSDDSGILCCLQKTGMYFFSSGESSESHLSQKKQPCSVKLWSVISRR